MSGSDIEMEDAGGCDLESDHGAAAPAPPSVSAASPRGVPINPESCGRMLVPICGRGEAFAVDRAKES